MVNSGRAGIGGAEDDVVGGGDEGFEGCYETKKKVSSRISWTALKEPTVIIVGGRVGTGGLFRLFEESTTTSCGLVLCGSGGGVDRTGRL